jgi:hypothetical protein
MALADLSGVRSAYQPVITLTSQGPAPVKGPGLPNNTICRVLLWSNAPLDQNHPATVRRAARGRTSTAPRGYARAGLTAAISCVLSRMPANPGVLSAG